MAKYPKYRDDDWGVPLKAYIDSFMGSAENVRLAREQIEATTRDLLAMYGATSGVENPTALAPFQGIDTTAQTARVVLIGDSISDGGMASTYASTISMRLQASLRQVLGRTGGYGYVSATPSTQGAIVPNVPNTRVGTAVMWSHGIGGRAMYLGAADHHVTYSAQQFTQIKVYYGKTTIAGGGLKVEFGDANGQNFVDQGVVLSSAASAGAGNSSGHVWASPVLGAAHRTVRITSFAPPYVGILEGVEFLNGDEASGLRVYNGAHSGGSVTAYNQASMNMHWDAVTKVNPHLTIVNLGTNDVAALTPVQFLSGMATLIEKIPPSSQVLLVGNYLRGDYNTPAGRDKWQQMQAGLRAMATGRVAYINLAPHWPELVANGSTSDGLMFDTPPIHPNDAGMKKISDVLAAAVGPTSNLAFVGPRGPKGATGDLTPASQTLLDTAVTNAEEARDTAVSAAQAAEGDGDRAEAARVAVEALASDLKVVNSEALGPFWAATGRRETDPVRIAFFGSSTTAGFNATEPSKRWVNRFVTRLQKAYPSGGAETATMTLSAATGNPPTAPGIQGINGGISGTNSSNYIESIAQYAIGVLNPVLIVHMPDSNDSAGGTITPAQTKTNILAKINAMSASRCHLLIHTFRRIEAGVTTAQWAEYARVKREIAEEKSNVAFIDISEEYERALAGGDPHDLIDTDAVHQTNAGHLMMADTVARLIGIS